MAIASLSTLSIMYKGNTGKQNSIKNLNQESKMFTNQYLHYPVFICLHNTVVPVLLTSQSQSNKYNVSNKDLLSLVLWTQKEPFSVPLSSLTPTVSIFELAPKNFPVSKNKQRFNPQVILVTVQYTSKIYFYTVNHQNLMDYF